MPKLGVTVEEAEVTQWFKNEGDLVAADEILLEVATDKVEQELPSPVSGRIVKILVTAGVVPVGTRLAEIDES